MKPKACPFCGNNPIVINVVGVFSVKCDKCVIGPRTPIYAAERNAIIMWNDRSVPPNLSLKEDSGAAS